MSMKINKDLLPIITKNDLPDIVSCIRIYLTSQYSYKSKNRQELSLTGTRSTPIGNLTLNNGKVRVGKNISYVFAYGQVYFYTGSNHTDGKLAWILKNGSAESSCHVREGYNYIHVNTAALIPVQEGDIISLGATNDKDVDTVIKDGVVDTFLSVIGF